MIRYMLKFWLICFLLFVLFGFEQYYEKMNAIENDAFNMQTEHATSYAKLSRVPTQAPNSDRSA